MKFKNMLRRISGPQRVCITLVQQIDENEDWGCGSIILQFTTTALYGGEWSNARPEGFAARVRAKITHKTRRWLDTETA
jgi:hypothetical protein